MAAANSDLFRKGGANTVTTLAAPGKALAATSITVGSTTNYPTDTGIVIGIRQVDSDGVLVPGTYSEYNATVTSGTTFSIDAVPVLGSDQVYPAGSTTQVFLPVSSSAHNDLIDGLVVSHNQDGTLKTDSVDSTQIKANAITNPKLAPGSVTVDKTDFPVSVEGNSSCTVVVPPSKKVAIWVQARDYDSASVLNLAASGANTVSNLLDGVYSDQVNQTVVGIRLYTFTNEGSTTLTLTGNSGGLSNTKIIAIPMLS